MRLIQFYVATNWDPKLIEELAKYPVADLYGVSNHTIVGGGRPSFLLPKISEEEIVDYVKKVHENNMTFSYLLNAPCMNNMEYDSHYHKELLKYIQWISDIGTDSVIVTIPFLIQLIKDQFPNLKIRVSTISHINSVNRAKFYEMLGADEITPDVMINRDFKTLEKIKKAVNCRIVLLLTDGCIYQYITTLAWATHNYTYYFECNDGSATDTSSTFNDLEVNKYTPPNGNGGEGGGGGGDDEEAIPGYNMMIIIAMIGVISIITARKFKKLKKSSTKKHKVYFYFSSFYIPKAN